MKKVPRLEDVHLVQVCDSFLRGESSPFLVETLRGS